MATDFTTWDRATLEQFAREAMDKLIENSNDIDRLLDASQRAIAEIKSNREAIAELVSVLTEYINAADNSMCPADDDDVAAMLRFADADNNARVMITKHQPPITD